MKREVVGGRQSRLMGSRHRRIASLTLLVQSDIRAVIVNEMHLSADTSREACESEGVFEIVFARAGTES